MNIQAEKELIIRQFKQIDDIDLINVIKKMLNYAIKKEQSIYNIPEEHQELVMNRFHKVRQNPDSLIDWNEAKKTLKS